MKKNLYRTVACVMAGSLICASLAGCGKKTSLVDTVVSDEEVLNTVIEKVVNAGSSTANKEETVYVKTTASGDVSSVIVSNWLKNADSTETLSDSTDLKDIVNVKGDESYTVEGDKIVWNAQGNDIYYQGTTDKQIPVSVDISYKLDGNKVAPEDIAGKSGHVEITFEYTNNAKQTVMIGSEEQTIYTPFVVASGLILDSDKFTNITVSNGTVVSDGNKQVVLGMAFPGLVDSLNGKEIKESEILEKIEDKLNIPGTVSVEADAKDFELGMTLTVVSSDVMGALGLEKVDVDADLDDAKEKVEDLKDATNQLLDGSNQLANGASELYDGTGKLTEGSKKLTDGIVEYTDGVGKVSDGVGQLSVGAGKLDDGIGQLSDGIGKLDNGASALNNGISSATDGAKKLDAGIAKVNTGAGTLKDGITSAKKGAASLDAGISQVDAGAGQVAQGAEDLAAGVTQLTGALGGLSSLGSAANGAAAISAGISAIDAATSQTKELTDDEKALLTVDLSGYGLTAEALEGLGLDSTTAATLAGTIQAVANGSLQNGVVIGANNAMSTINAAINDTSSGTSLVAGSAALASGLSQAGALDSPETTAKITALVNGANSLADGAAALKAGTSQLAAGSSSLVSGLGQLEAGATTLSKGTAELATGSKSLVTGMGQLQSGSNELCSGFSQVSSGAAQLKNGSSELLAGTGKLSDGVGQLTANSGKLVSGSKELTDGTVTLSEGALKLADGSKKLNDGMVQFDEEGIKKISDVFDTNLSTMSDRIKAITDLAKEYKSFAGSLQEEDSAVRFIIESEGVKAN